MLIIVSQIILIAKKIGLRKGALYLLLTFILLMSQKNTANGYDGVIAYWFKFHVDNEYLIKRLRQEKTRKRK